MAAGSTGLPGAGTGAPPAAPPAAAPAAGAGTPPAGAGSPPAASAGSPPAGATPNSPAGPQGGNDANIAVLRQSHELLTRLGGGTAAEQAVQRWTQLQTSSKELATRLGFTPESFDEAWATDPSACIAELQAEQAEQARATRGNQGPTNGNQGPRPNDDLDRRLKPIEDMVRRQQATEANQRVEGEFNRLFDANDLFKGKQVPKPIRDGLYNFLADSLKYEPEVLRGVMQGKVDGIEKVFQSTLTGAVQFINAWNQWMTGAAAPGPTGQPGPAAGGQPGQGSAPAAPKPGFLDSLANGEDEAFASLPGFRGR